MEGDRPTVPRKSRRTAHACIACRQSKIKCSGEEPCQNCKRRVIHCQFAQDGNKILVSERYLQALQRRAVEHQRSPPTTSIELTTPIHNRIRSPETRLSISNAPASISPPLSRSLSRNGASVSWSNEFTPRLVDGVSDENRRDIRLVSPSSIPEGPRSLENAPGEVSNPAFGPMNRPVQPQLGIWSNIFSIPSKTIKNTGKNKRSWIWLAPWSTWSFTVRLMLMLGEKLHPENPPIPPSLVATETYAITWSQGAPTETPDITGLPALNHAIYLFNAVKFHLGQTYQLFDAAEFEAEIHEFYSNSLDKASQHNLWFIKFLLILAFGTAFHSPPPPSNTREPPGVKFFKRAMSLMPDPACIWKESLLAIEVLALIGLYLFSVDERESAYLYLGQAMRIAQFEGLHTRLPEHEIGVEAAAYCRGLWWTLYIMDRHFSSSVGLPMSIQDSDITAPVSPPYTGSQEDTSRALQVNLSHLLSVILTTVYKPDITSLSDFLEQTRSILHTLAHHAQQIETICLGFQNSVGTLSRGTRYITLLYHQCVIVATRPLLLSVLKERLDLVGFPCDENWESFLAQTGSVISTGIKSAAKTLQILTSEYSLLEAFLSYDVEFAFGAAIQLAKASALFPEVEDYEECRRLAHRVLGDLAARGNRVAQARESELCHLENLCQEVVARAQQQGHQTLQLANIQGVELTRKEGENIEADITAENEPGSLEVMTDPDHAPHYINPQMSHGMDFLDDIGISSEDFLSIVQQIGDPENLPENMLTLV